MRKIFAGIFALTTASAFGLGTPAHAVGDGPVFPRPKTYNALKFAYTVRQERDFTCGAAALATLLKYHYGMPVTEYMLIAMILKRYTEAQWKVKAKEGLSFEDLIFVAKKLGFNAAAAVVKPEEVEKLSGPVIIQLDMKENDHFTVLRKKTAETAYLSDPITGATTLDENEFLKKFRGPVLAVWPSYVKGDFFSGLYVVRDPMNVERAVTTTIPMPRFSPTTQ